MKHTIRENGKGIDLLFDAPVDKSKNGYGKDWTKGECKKPGSMNLRRSNEHTRINIR